MCSSAELNGVGEAYYAYLVSIFLAKESHSAHIARLLYRDIPAFVLHYVSPYIHIYSMLYLPQSLEIYLLKVRKVKP